MLVFVCVCVCVIQNSSDVILLCHLLSFLPSSFRISVRGVFRKRSRSFANKASQRRSYRCVCVIKAGLNIPPSVGLLPHSLHKTPNLSKTRSHSTGELLCLRDAT